MGDFFTTKDTKSSAGIPFASSVVKKDLSRGRKSLGLNYIAQAAFQLAIACFALSIFSSPTQAEDGVVIPQPVFRQRPGSDPQPVEFSPFIFESVPDIQSSAPDFVAIPDRWRQFYAGRWFDPYNQNVLKGDIPVFGSPGHEWFFEASIISDTLLERRTLPLPVGGQSTKHPGSNDTFGSRNQNIRAQNLITSFSLIRGNTSFKPPEFELRVTPAFNFNYVSVEETGVLNADPGRGTDRTDEHVGFNELFVDVHLANLTDRYDFVSSRVGIQRFISDFRGFVFADEALGTRFFGNYDNNFWQYNLAYFSRLDKDTNSGINTFDLKHEDIILGNLYLQDAIAFGHTMQFSVLHRIDNAGNNKDHYDNNGFLVRPAAIGDERSKNVYNTYFGLAGDGHFGRINTTSAFYYVTGSESHNAIAQRQVNVSAGMAAVELSYDQDWIRYRSSIFWASGDSDPFDGTATGFDAIADNPNFAGGDLGYWQRLNLPLIGGGGVPLKSNLSLLPNLRSSKGEGQSNFVNPGLRMYNLGIDFELTPKLKLINNLSFLQFDNTAVLQVVRQDGSFSRNIGYDLSTGLLYRPFLNNNVLIRVGASALFPDDGLENLYGDGILYDVFSNLILQY